MSIPAKTQTFEVDAITDFLKPTLIATAACPPRRNLLSPTNIFCERTVLVLLARPPGMRQLLLLALLLAVRLKLW